MDIILYYAPTTCALVPWITLTEVGAQFDTIPLNLKRNEHKTLEFLAVNPAHKVPTLVVDGKVLTENVAIQQWVHRTYPSVGILPFDPWDELTAISILSWCSSGIHPLLTRINNPRKVCQLSEGSKNIVQTAVDGIEECLHIADNLLCNSLYFFSEFTAADVHFFWCCRRASQFDIDLTAHTNVVRHYENIQCRESVTKLLAFEAEIVSGFK